MAPPPIEFDLYVVLSVVDSDIPERFWGEVADTKVTIDDEPQSRKLAGTVANHLPSFIAPHWDHALQAQSLHARKSCTKTQVKFRTSSNRVALGLI